MDTWIVAVAAGAGYIARHFKKRGGRFIGESPAEDSGTVGAGSPKQPADKKCPFRVKREKFREDDSEVKSEGSKGGFSTEVASISEFDGEKGVVLDNFEDSSVFASSSLFSGFIASDGVSGDVEGVRESERMGDLLRKSLTSEVGPSYGYPRSRRVLRSRRSNGRSVRPLSSLESCLMAQLYKEHVEMEEHMFSSFASPSTQTVRPFFVTDGSKVISRAVGDVFPMQNNNVDKKRPTYSEGNGVVCGVPPLPHLWSLKIGGKDEVNTRKDGKGRFSHSSTTPSGKHNGFPRGSSDAALLLCLGMSFGIISSFLASRLEVEKLKGLLKQTENLVQDFQEELEMKDSLTVQELTVEDHTSQHMHDDSFEGGPRCSISHERSLEVSTRYDKREFLDQKAKDDSMSKIEAELEAELEMLEQNMTSSSLERRFSDLVELASDFVPDVAQGELRAEMFSNQARKQVYADQDGSGSAAAHSTNYAVSPRELSLRLHEVLESQLAERIKELEAEIKSTQSHQKQKHFQDFSSSETGDEYPLDEPVVLNLSGEALDAYNEAYEEFSKIDESEDEDSPREPTDNKSPRSSSQMCIDHGDGVDFGDDEMEKMLIKHIVEKARKGSHVVLNAQRALFSMELG